MFVRCPFQILFLVCALYFLNFGGCQNGNEGSQVGSNANAAQSPQTAVASWQNVCTGVGKCEYPIQAVLVSYSKKSVDLKQHSECLKKNKASCTEGCFWCKVMTTGDGYAADYFGETYGTEENGVCVSDKLYNTGDCLTLVTEHLQPIDTESKGDLKDAKSLYPKLTEQAKCLELSADATNCTANTECKFCVVPKDIYSWTQGGFCLQATYLNQKVQDMDRCQQIAALTPTNTSEIDMWKMVCSMAGAEACKTTIQSVIMSYATAKVNLTAHAGCLEQDTETKCADKKENGESSCEWCSLTTPGTYGTPNYFETTYGSNNGVCISKSLTATVGKEQSCSMMVTQHLLPVDNESKAASTANPKVTLYPKMKDQATCLVQSNNKADCEKVEAGCTFCEVPETIYKGYTASGFCFDSKFMAQKVNGLDECGQIQALQVASAANATSTASPTSTTAKKTEPQASSGFVGKISTILATLSVFAAAFLLE